MISNNLQINLRKKYKNFNKIKLNHHFKSIEKTPWKKIRKRKSVRAEILENKVYIKL